MENLKKIRQSNGLSQREVSQALSIPQTTLFSYEAGVCDPNVETLIKLADYFKISLDELVGRPTNLINVAILTNTQQDIINRVCRMSDKEQEYTLLYLKMRDNSL